MTREPTESTEQFRQLALRGLHQSRGANWSVERGVRVPTDYGDPAGERRALAEDCALWDASGCDRLELLGSDRHRFLNGMMTADIAALEVGSSCYGLFTNVKGRILADATVLALPDRLWIRVPASTGAEIREHLSRFIITDQVEILPLADMIPIVLAGPAAPAAVARRLDNGDLPEPGEHRRVELDGTEVCLLSEPRFGTAAFSLWVSASLAPGFVSVLLAGSDAPRIVGLEAVESLRVERGIPRFGAELGADTFPQEAGVDDAVSYEKGCYLGQEVVARIHYRGGVQRVLVQLDIVGESSPVVGETVSFEGREAGQLSSVASPLEGANWLALAILAKRATEPGTVVVLSGGAEATVRQPPGGSP